MIIRNIKRMIVLTFMKIGVHYAKKGGSRDIMTALNLVERAIPFMDEEACEILKDSFGNMNEELQDEES